MPTKTAMILGASGSVGQALVHEVVQSGAFSRVILFTRRPLAFAGVEAVEQHLVPTMTPELLTQAVIEAAHAKDFAANQAEPQDLIGFSVLGVGANTAKLTLEQHRAVDVELNAAFAKGLKASGMAKHLLLMSAIGADINAKTSGSGAAGMPRYARVKGEAEAAVKREGPPQVSIFRPSVIVGSTHTPKLVALLFKWIAPLLPSRYRAIETRDIAKAMVAAALTPTTHHEIAYYQQMQAWIAHQAKG